MENGGLNHPAGSVALTDNELQDGWPIRPSCSRDRLDIRPAKSQGRLEFANKASCCLCDEIASQMDWLFPISANGLHCLQQIPAVAGPGAPIIVVIPFVQVFHGLWARIHPQLLDDGVENARVDVPGRSLDAYLVANTTQEGVVDEVLGIQVRRKDRELLERHLEFLAGCHRQEVVSIFQRQDPAIEQFLGTAKLPAKI